MLHFNEFNDLMPDNLESLRTNNKKDSPDGEKKRLTEIYIADFVEKNYNEKYSKKYSNYGKWFRDGRLNIAIKNVLEGYTKKPKELENQIGTNIYYLIKELGLLPQ